MSANDHAAVHPAALDAQDAGEATAHEVSVRDSETTPKLSRYTVLKKLAVGGMAEIFIAQREGAEDICVVKLLHEHLSKDPVVSNRFLREAQVASLLDHKHIARLTDSKREAGLLYLAMEFIGGQDVESMMFKLMEQRKMLPPELSVTVTLDVLEGLHYAHEFRGPDGKHLEIVHRDLSPRNVMVTYTGDVKIIDFGLARTNLGDFRTAPGMVLGTLRYMSPEQAVAEPVDRRSDVYSWSVVLYEMLSGRPLVTGASAQEVLHSVVTLVPPPLSTLNPTLPKALDAVLEKGLAKDRRDRFPTANDLRQALLEAAGPLGAIDRERHDLIGQFVRELFPEDYTKSIHIVEQARRGEVDDTPHEITRYADSMEQEAVSAQYLPTALKSITRAEGDELKIAQLPVMARGPSGARRNGAATMRAVSESGIPTALVHGPYVIDTATLSGEQRVPSVVTGLRLQPPPKNNLLLPAVVSLAALVLGLVVVLYVFTKPASPISGPAAAQIDQAPSAAARPSATSASDPAVTASRGDPPPQAEQRDNSERAARKQSPRPAKQAAAEEKRAQREETPAPSPPPPAGDQRYGKISGLLNKGEQELNRRGIDTEGMPVAITSAEELFAQMLEGREDAGSYGRCSSTMLNSKGPADRIRLLRGCINQMQDEDAKRKP